jgi:LPPG:FO 2-phospho-L-lactate transferase
MRSRSENGKNLVVKKVTALTGGVGGAKLIAGLAEIVRAEDLTVIVNTGDDWQWMDLYISPDLDTIVYTLAGSANAATGWGVEGDTFHALDRLRAMGVDAWFRLGDKDLATHIYRTSRLRSGATLSEVTRDLCRRHGIRPRILPMTDSYVPTFVHTDAGTMHLQEYFVQRRCEPRVEGFEWRGIEAAFPAPGVREAIEESDAVLVCPSNPFISIGPILALSGIRWALAHTRGTTLAVSPIISGRAVKGPAADMLAQLGYPVSPLSVARMYSDFLDGFVLDREDAGLAAEIAALELDVIVCPTRMSTHEDCVALARSILERLSKPS